MTIEAWSLIATTVYFLIIVAKLERLDRMLAALSKPPALGAEKEKPL